MASDVYDARGMVLECFQSLIIQNQQGAVGINKSVDKAVRQYDGYKPPQHQSPIRLKPLRHAMQQPPPMVHAEPPQGEYAAEYMQIG